MSIMPSARNVAAAKPYAGGGVFYAPAGTALPTNGYDPLSEAFIALGYLSNDGIQPQRETNVEKKAAFGGDVVASLLQDESRAFEFTLWEVFRRSVQEWIHGAENVTITPADADHGTQTSVRDVGGKRSNCVLVFELMHGTKRRRLVVGDADYVVTGEAPYTDNELTGYTVTVEAIKVNGVRVHEYLVQDDRAAG